MEKKEKKTNYSIQGKKNRAAGSRFELKVRKDLEEKGYVVDKWTNNVDLENKKIIASKRKFNPFLKVFSIGTGFPDFICFKPKEKEIIGVEVKRKGYLSKEEKEKCKFYILKNIFSKIDIAKEVREEEDKRKTDIKYVDFEEYNKK